MPLFSRFKSKGANSASRAKGNNALVNGNASTLQKPRWQTTWTSKTVDPDEVQELIHACTAEMKSRAEALDAPFLLLPFRPHSDASYTPTFIRNYYSSNAEGSDQYKGAKLRQELRLTESIVLCSIIKWCWSRIPGGVVTWAAYEGFKIGEKESNLDRSAFGTFIPLSVDSPARSSIIFDFFDLLAAVAAHGKKNGLGGRKVSRLAGWWAFEHTDDGDGFEGGYRSWVTAADACSHLFFAYLRSQSPEANPAMSLIERIPRSLQALLASTEYPPETPSLMQRSTPRVVMVVDHVSPTPFALLRRAKHFEYRDQDKVLREYQEFEDPLDALTEECKRVLLAISSANTKQPMTSQGSVSKPEESWSAFQTTGFNDLEDKPSDTIPTTLNRPASPNNTIISTEPRSRAADMGRPTTPSWAEFMSSGFADDAKKQSQATLMLPPDKVLPSPVANRVPTPSRSIIGDESLMPGELAAIKNLDLDDAFWWVWMTSLASEEPANRKAVFGRCALIETTIQHGQWLIVEEQVKGASPDPIKDAYIAPKRSIFATLTMRGRLARKRSTSKKGLMASPETLTRDNPASVSKSSLAPDQHNRIKAAAAALASKPPNEKIDEANAKRGRIDEGSASKTNSTLTVGVMSEATPAMKWASAYDKKAIRAQYLGDAFAGKGMSREELSRVSSIQEQASPEGINKATPALPAEESTAPMVGHDLAAAAQPPLATAEELPIANANVSQTNDESLAAAVPPANVAAVEKSDAPEPPSKIPRSTKDNEKNGRGSGATSPIARKALSSPKHPALRQDNIEEEYEAAPAPIIARKASSPQISRSAAALAAAKAMKTVDASEAANRSKKQASSSGGFKRIFGSRREPARGDLSKPLPDATMNRHAVQPHQSSQNATDKSYQIAAAQSAAGQVPHTRPQAYSSDTYDEDDAVEEAAAHREFSRFDQGPMEDMPAAVPQSPTEDAHREIETRDSHTNESSHAFESKGVIEPEHFEQDKGDEHARVAEDSESEVVDDDPSVYSQVDRWAAIRDNAARRAATRGSEEQSYQSHQSRPSQGGRTDDGETSGEETIESRVARIKARVAELTGGLDQASTSARR